MNENHDDQGRFASGASAGSHNTVPPHGSGTHQKTGDPTSDSSLLTAMRSGRNFSAAITHPDKSVQHVTVQARSPFEATKEIAKQFPQARLKTFPAASAFSNTGVISTGPGGSGRLR